MYDFSQKSYQSYINNYEIQSVFKKDENIIS